MQWFLLDRNTNQNHEIEHSSLLPRSREENLNLNQKDQQSEVESFMKMVSTDSEVSARPELRSNHDGQDIENMAPSPEGLTHNEFVNQIQFGSFTESKSEAETASFKDSQDFLAIISQLNRTLENIKNQELLIQEGKTIYQSL